MIDQMNLKQPTAQRIEDLAIPQNPVNLSTEASAIQRQKYKNFFTEGR